MNILVFSQYFHPERFLINEICYGLVKRGHKVTIVTGQPNYPEGKIYKGYKNKTCTERIQGVKVIRCKIIPRGNSHIKLALNYFSYMISTSFLQKRLKKKYDVVFVYQLTPVLQIFPAIQYCKRNRKKLFCYCLDLAPASGQSVLSKVPFAMNTYKKFARYLYNSCDLIAVTSKSFIKYFNDVHSVDSKRLIYIPQHASEIFLEEDLSKARTAKIEFMFAGNIGTVGSLDTIIYAAETLKNKNYNNFVIHFVGEGSYKKDLIKLVNQKGLSETVLFHDAVSQEQMPEYYRKVDALLVTLCKNNVTIPGKVQAYMAVGKPIFGAMNGSGFDLINESKCGVCVEAENAIALAKIMEDFILNPQKYEECGHNGKRYFRNHFTLEHYINSLESCFEAIKDNSK